MQTEDFQLEPDVNEHAEFEQVTMQSTIDNDVYQNKPQNKRIRLADDFESVLLKTDIRTDPNTSTIVYDCDVKTEDSGISRVQTGMTFMDIKDEYEIDTLPLLIDNQNSLSENFNNVEKDPLSTTESMHQCTECDYSVITDVDLENHMRVFHEKHNVPEKLKCPECDYTAVKKTMLLKHTKIKHPEHEATITKTDTFVGKEESISQTDESKNEAKAETSGNTHINIAKDENVDDADLSDTKPIIGINKVDDLLTIDFSKLSLKEQLAIKKLGPHRPTCIEVHQTDKMQNRYFSEKWFDKIEWLTVSESSKRFFCFYCLLFGGEVTWSKTGYNNLKHFSEKVTLHESTAVHLNNAVKFKIFGIGSIAEQLNIDTEDTEDSVYHHNDAVEKHRRILKAIIASIHFVVSQDIPLPDEGEDTEFMFNRKVFLSLIELVQTFDDAVYDDIHNSTRIDYTTEAIQNELIDCMYHIYRDELRKDIEKANFVSVHVEYLSNSKFDYYNFAIILRYMKDGVVVERLHSFIEVTDVSASNLALAIHKELEPYNLRCKLIAQTYDGSVTMGGRFGGVQSCLKHFYPHALFVHSYAHSFDKILSQSCSTILSGSMFFGGIAMFVEYFSFPTSRRNELLKSECDKIPSCVENKWDSVFDTIKTIYHNQEALTKCFGKILDESSWWSSECIYEATNLRDLLKDDEEFLFFLTFFYKILHHVEELDKAFQARTLCGDIMTTLKYFETTIMDMAGSALEDIKPGSAKLKIDTNEVCSIIVSEIRERLEATDHLVTFSVVNPNKYKKMYKFPNDHVHVLACRYRMLMQGKLTSELKVLYNNETFAGVKSASSLLNVLTENELQATFSEACKLIEIVLATPATPAPIISEEWNMSTMERLQEFISSEWLPEKLHIFATFKIHRDAIDNMHHFIDHVIDYFAKKEPGRERFL